MYDNSETWTSEYIIEHAQEIIPHSVKKKPPLVMETSPAPQELCDGITSKFQSAVITDMTSDMQDQFQRTVQKE